MSSLNRRDFLKALGIGSAASAATACSDTSLRWDPMVPIENVLPYVVQPENIIPGLSTWYASRCDQCAAGCGTMVRTREGRVVKVEGNPNHPGNRGKLCTRGQAGLQAPYSPDRFDGPQQGGTAMDWQAAAKAAADAVQAARSANKKIVWLGQYRSGASAAVVEQFAAATGGAVMLWEPLGQDALQAAVKAVFGKDALPSYDLSGAHTIVSFGADFLHTFGPTVSQSLGYGDSKDPNVGGFVGRFVAIEPRGGATSALADLLLQVKPGSETGVAMALAKLVADKKQYSGPATSVLASVDVAGAAGAAGIDAKRLEEVADWLSANPSVVLPGGTSTAAPDDVAVASLILNEVAGNIGRSVIFGQETGVQGRVTTQTVVDLLKSCAAGEVGVLFLDGVDPVYALPGDVGAQAALEKLGGGLVIFANEPTDAITSGALVLPPGTGLERWGDAESVKGRYTLQQPAMRPLKDTRSAEDVLLAIAQLLGLKAPEAVAAVLPVEGEGEAVPVEPVPADAVPAEGEAAEPVAALPPVAQKPNLDAATFKDYLSAWWKAEVFPQAGGDSFGRFWTESLQRGGYFVEVAAEGATFQLGTAPSGAATALAGGGDLDLILFPHIRLYDGRHANKPWAQEVPDGLTQFAWGSWLEVHPKTAARLGLTKKNSAVLKTDAGSIEVGWFGSPGMREDAVAVVMGNGHEGAGRYAGFGANPMKLVPFKADKSGAIVLTAVKATVSAGSKQNTPSTAGALTTENRPSINHTVSIDDVGKGHGAGSIVAVHHPPIDQRVKDSLPTVDMYPEPSHPTYRFAMSVDLSRCTGCGACQTACYAENNNALVGPEQIRLGRTMGWIRLSRYWNGEGENQDLRFQPVMCQQCSHAPCEGVCPVLATYHNLDGLNAMVYNRCVGTRYCANNCPWSARRFNYHTYRWPESFNMMLNPDVLVREMGVMEKCTFCVQRIREVKEAWRDDNKRALAPDAALQKLTACAQSCPADAITFGNVKDESGLVAQKFEDERAYTMLGELNAKPGVRYLARVTFGPSALHHGGGHGGGHGEDHGGGASHGDAGHGGGGEDHGDAGHGGAAGGEHHEEQNHGAESSGGHH